MLNFRDMNADVNIQVTAPLRMADHSTLLARPATSAARMAIVSFVSLSCHAKLTPYSFPRLPSEGYER